MNNSIFFDPAINRKSKLVQASLQYFEGIPLPSIIEISESGTCNRKCVFCPRSDPNFPDIQEFISKDLIIKISNDLKSVNYSGIILFSGFVEPLLDKEIYQKIALIRSFLKLPKIELVTNGDVLDLKRLNQLFFSGLDTILISVYDSAADAKKYKDMCETAGLREDQYVIRHRYLPPEENFGITINNRSGMMSSALHAIPILEKPSIEPCYYPHYTFFIDYLGDVLVCPHDWGKKMIAGNISRDSFKNIWLGEKFTRARKMLEMGNRNLNPCNKCDVKGTLIGESHVNAWLELTKN